MTASALEVERTRHELCDAADAVVIAEVTSSETVWEEGPDGALLTRVWFAPTLAVRGDAGVGAIELLLPGGVKGEIEHYVEDTPKKPQRDRRYLLFLVFSPRGGFRVIGGEGGAVALNGVRHSDGERYLDAVISVAGCGR
jgi:hypothetical protein